MTGKYKQPVGTRQVDEAARALRREAEDWLRTDAAQPGEDSLAHPSPEDSSPMRQARILHDLRVHEIMLVMQNEELRRTRSELEESRARFVDLYDSAPSGYCSVSDTWEVVQANLTLGALLGVHRGAVVGQPLSVFVAAEDQDNYHRFRQRLVKSGASASGELRMVKSDRAAFWAHLTAHAVKNRGGIDAYDIAISDITALKETELSLRSSEAALREAEHVAHVGHWTWDIPYNRIQWADEIKRIHGLAPAESRDDVSDLITVHVHPDDRGLVEAAARAVAVSGEGEAPLEYRVVRPDGDVRTVMVILGKSSKDEMGRISKLAGVLLDITELRRAERQRAESLRTLAQAEKLESIGRLTSGIAHDYNNMLSVILGNTELAMGQAPPTMEANDSLREIQSAALRSAELTRQLLTFAREEPVSPTVLDVNLCVTRSLRMLLRLLGPNVRLDWQPVDGLWPILMDSSQLGQLLVNLCINARDAMKGTGVLSVLTENCVLDAVFCAATPNAVPGEYVRIVVRDNGCGMTSEVKSRVFDPFFTTKSVGEGTGLGLATLHGAVTQAGGFVTLASAAGEGATFALYFPRHAAPMVPDAAPPVAPPPLGRETILVVEDEPAVLRMLDIQLTLIGYTVLCAAGPSEAIRIMQEQKGAIDLLLTDVVMPQMNGIELSRRLRAVHPELKCVFMSGQPAGIVDRCGPLEHETRFIRKPFTIAALAVELRHALESAPA